MSGKKKKADNLVGVHNADPPKLLRKTVCGRPRLVDPTNSVTETTVNKRQAKANKITKPKQNLKQNRSKDLEHDTRNVIQGSNSRQTKTEQQPSTQDSDGEEHSENNNAQPDYVDNPLGDFVMVEVDQSLDYFESDDEKEVIQRDDKTEIDKLNETHETQ